jgi:hypothetical protein
MVASGLGAGVFGPLFAEELMFPPAPVVVLDEPLLLLQAASIVAPITSTAAVPPILRKVLCIGTFLPVCALATPAF